MKGGWGGPSSSKDNTSEPGSDRYIIDNVRDGLLYLNVRIVSSIMSVH